jgi:hypothetical protein
MTMLLEADDRELALNLPPLTSDVLPSIFWVRRIGSYDPAEIMGDFSGEDLNLNLHSRWKSWGISDRDETQGCKRWSLDQY